MKWIAFSLVAIGALLFVDHSNGFVPLALGVMLLGYWYLFAGSSAVWGLAFSEMTRKRSQFTFIHRSALRT
jgi:ABC-type transport system involved in multi-copper enzyme maturation permease subunit